MNNDGLCKALKRLSYVSSPAYISFLYHLLRADNDPLFEEDFTMLNMFYYSLYQDTPDVIGFKDPMDFVTSLREHTDDCKEFLDFLSIQYAEQKSLKNKIDLGYDCVLDLYSRYSLNEILAAFDYWNWSNCPAMREGVLYLPDKKTDLLFVTLKNREDEYSSTTTYEDYFIDKEQFHWQSQSTTPDTSSVGQRYINHIEMGTQVLLFVREQKVKQGITVPYIFLGKVSYVKHEGSKPMNIIWKLEKPVPDEIYAELYVDRSKSSDESGIESPGKSIKKVQTSMPSYYVEEGFHPPISIEIPEITDVVKGEEKVIEFEVKIVKNTDTLSVITGNAFSIIKKNFFGYTIDPQSTFLSQALNLSKKVLETRESLKYIQQLSHCTFDSTILRLTNYCTFPSLSLALEMVVGCKWVSCLTFDALPAESVWKYSFDVSNMQSSVVEKLPDEIKEVNEVGVETDEAEDPREVDVVCPGSTENEGGVKTEETDGQSFDASTGYPDKLSENVVCEVKLVKKKDHTLYVYAGNAVAAIKKYDLGYTIGTQCTILNQELGLSENGLSIRQSLKSKHALSTCSFDSTLLRLRDCCLCPTFPLALEMITGCGSDNCPSFDALPAESVWKYSYNKAGQTSPDVMQLAQSVGDKVGIGEENTSLPKETKLESLSCEAHLSILRDKESEKINMGKEFENPPVTPDMGHGEGKQSLAADSNNDNNSSLVSNYSISLEGELLLIKTEDAFAKVKKADGHYILLRGSTFNNSLRTLANHDALKHKQKLIFEGYLTSISNSLWELESFNAVFDDLHTIVEMVVGFPCDPNEVLTKESELFRWKKEELKEEKPALNVESSEFIESIETPGFASIYSWDLAFGESATKHVDKSVISYNGSGVPMEICPFFQADSLNPGDKIELILQYGGKNFTGHII
ncbi:MAG: DUF3427 domain-containing protein, partial [Methanocorpusculum sp.]|nr:DUF3427 domain-containing protein [Methanocorpusculum sp.]